MTHTRLLLLAALTPALALAACKKSEPAPDVTGPSNAAVVETNSAAPVAGWVDTVVATPEGGFRMGNPNASAKLIEYGSRTCPHCGDFAKESLPDIKQVVAAGKLSYEFRDFPIHAPDLAAILLGQCNGAQSFFPILEGMFADQPNTLPKLEKLPPTLQAAMQGKSVNEQAVMWADYLGYTDFVGQRGVPEAKAKACLADPKAVDMLSKRLQALGQSIQYTPSFIINGGDVVSGLTWPQIKSQLGG
jgi:protein-disulfide isomerase